MKKIDTCKNCTSGLDSNCIVCSGDPTKCDRCRDGYYRVNLLKEEICQTCTDCVDNYHYITGSKDGTGVCELCEVNIPGCVTCSRDGTHCLSCVQGKYLFSSANLKNDTYDQCVECTDNNQYVKTAHVNNSGGVCEYCKNAFENCDECNGDLTSCEKCLAGFYQFDLDENTAGFEKCISCVETLFYKQETVCRLCNRNIPHCLECNQDGSLCEKCEKNYFKYKTSQEYDTCLPCNLAPEYKINPDSTGLGQCELCINTNSLCVDCNGNPNLCSSCIADYYTYDTANNDVLNACVKCDLPDYDGHFIDASNSN